MATPQENMQINGQITKAQSAREIITLIDTRLESFNMVNCATALHRLAKNYQNQTRTPTVLALLGHFTSLMTYEPRSCQPRQLSSSLWACAQLGVKDASFLTKAYELTNSKLRWFKSQELSNVLWAIAKLRSSESSGESDDISQLLDAIAYAVINVISEFTPQGLSNTCWSFATLSHLNEEVMEALKTEIRPRLADFNAQELSNVLWSFAKLQVKIIDLIEDMRPHLIKNTPKFSSQHLANIHYAIAKFVDEDPSTKTEGVDSLVAHFYPVIRTQANRFNNQELSMIVWALSVLGVECREKSSMKEDGMEAANSLLAVCAERVKKFTVQQLSVISLGFAKLSITDFEFLNNIANLAMVSTQILFPCKIPPPPSIFFFVHVHALRIFFFLSVKIPFIFSLTHLFF